MEKPRPGDADRERGGSGFSSRPFRNTAPVAPFQDPQPSRHLDDIARAEVRALWWRLRRQGLRLPPELGVIVVINGGADPNWPVPRTETPQPETGRGGKS